MATIHRRIILKDLNDPDNQVKDTKGTFHAKMGAIKDRNGRDLTEAEDNKKRWQNTQNYTKKVLMTWTTTMVWSFTYS